MGTIVKGYRCTQEIAGADRTTALALDEKTRTLCLAVLSPGFFGYSVQGFKIVSHSDLVSTEVVEDGETITRTMRMSQIGGAIVGGVLFGGVGAVVGALTGKTSANSKVRSLDLKITVNDLHRPVHTIRFLDAQCMRGDDTYRQAAKKAEHWNALLSVLIKQADEENRQRSEAAPLSSVESQTPPRRAPTTRIAKHNEAEAARRAPTTLPQPSAPPVSQLSVADELSKLARLLEMDLLTREEFNEQKQILLGKGKPQPNAATRISGHTKQAVKITRADLGNLECLQKLLDQGADPNEPIADDFRAPPLFQVLMESGTLAAIKLLVEHGADVNAEWHGSRPLDSLIIRDKASVRIRDYLISNGAVRLHPRSNLPG